MNKDCPYSLTYPCPPLSPLFLNSPSEEQLNLKQFCCLLLNSYLFGFLFKWDGSFKNLNRAIVLCQCTNEIVVLSYSLLLKLSLECLFVYYGSEREY